MEQSKEEEHKVESQEKPEGRNPHIEVPDPYEAYNDNRDEFVKHNPETMEAARLCYEVFECNDFGKQLLKLYEDRFLFQSLVNPLANNASESALYWAGFTDCIKGFKSYVIEHQQRISACQD